MADDAGKLQAQTQVTEQGDAVGSKPSKTFVERLRGEIRDPNAVGKALLQRALEFDEAQLERDAVRVRRKLDLIVIPMVCFARVVSGAFDSADDGLIR
jgi:hypothetical protein